MFACGFCTHIDVFVQKIAKNVGQVQIINLLFFIICPFGDEKILKILVKKYVK